MSLLVLRLTFPRTSTLHRCSMTSTATTSPFVPTRALHLNTAHCTWSASPVVVLQTDGVSAAIRSTCHTIRVSTCMARRWQFCLFNSKPFTSFAFHPMAYSLIFEALAGRSFGPRSFDSRSAVSDAGLLFISASVKSWLILNCRV